MQAFQWHGKPSLTATKLAFSRAGVLLFLLWISFFLPVLGSSNVSSRPPPGCTGTFSWMDGWMDRVGKKIMDGAGSSLQARFAVSCSLSFHLPNSLGYIWAGGTAGSRRGIEYRPSIKLPRPSDGDCGTLVLSGMPMQHGLPLAMSRLTSHRKTVGSEENANYLRLIINGRDTANPRQSLAAV